ncbi:expressed unknown protein [Seminavis robusta]|uniref:Uncharacterized protein n=1 Tax=Seminavis robusta TaxID=568900 RepID=A0A9N8EF19_9STRA|nr:expressed unknown protein [Seminavis robusta]|eukprot:Sro1087_g239860.1 n/a (305) ;mRNA; r:24313-25227
MSNRPRGLTQIPLDVEYLPHDHLISILRAVVNERDELYIALQNEQAKSASAAAAAAVAAATNYQQHHNNQGHHNPNSTGNHHDPFGFHYQDHHHHHPPPLPLPPPGTNNNNNPDAAPTGPAAPTTGTTYHHPPAPAANENVAQNNHMGNNNTVPSSFKVDTIKKRIGKKSFLLVKKTAHNKAKKPWTELNEAVPNASSAMALFDGFPPKSDTHRLTKWELTGPEVIEWLSTPSSTVNKYIHPVKFDGKVIAFGGAKPFVYAWASYESMQARFDKKGSSLSLKFRTKMVGSGRPVEGKDGPPSLT